MSDNSTASQYQEKLAGRDILFIAIVSLAPVLLAIIYFIAEARCPTGPGFPLDDPWIHFQFARNIAEGHGFCFNPGTPVAGSTSPLWTAILATVHLLFDDTADIVVAAKVVGVALLAAASALCYLITKNLTSSRAAALVAGTFLGTNCFQSFGAVSGMEVPLYLMLTMLAVHLATRKRSSTNDLALGAVLAASVYARPECMLLFGFLVLDLIIKKQYRSIILVTIVYAALLAPYFLLNQSLSGAILPMTFHAKAGHQSIITAIRDKDLFILKRLFTHAGPVYFQQSMAHLYRSNPLIVPGAFIGAFVMVLALIKRDPRGSALIPSIAIIYAACIGVAAPFRGADFQTGRYIANQTGVAVMLAVLGYYWLAVWMKSRNKWAAALLAAALLSIGGANAVTAQRSMARMYASDVDSINSIQVNLATWLRDNAVPGTTVMTPDVGAIGYFSGLRVIDLGGLVSPEFLAFNRAHRGQDGVVIKYARKVRPDYLVVFPNFSPGLVQAFPNLHSARKQDNTASQYTFTIRARTFAGVVLRGLAVEPKPSELVVLKYRREK